LPQTHPALTRRCSIEIEPAALIFNLRGVALATWATIFKVNPVLIILLLLNIASVRKVWLYRGFIKQNTF
jgi:hypothetical protein